MKNTIAFLLGALAISAANVASAAVFNYTVNLTGPSEFPANASPGTGSGTISYDSTSHLLSLNVSFTGLTGTTTASHIHAPTTVSGVGSEAVASAAQTAGVATTTPSFALFPLGVTSGVFANVLDLTQGSSWNAAYVTANGGTNASAEAAFALALAQGKAYWNIHTSTFGGGEIRGFATPVPEPAALALLGGVLVGCLAHFRRKSS
jgi:hypothetical protein